MLSEALHDFLVQFVSFPIRCGGLTGPEVEFLLQSGYLTHVDG
jgi:hypothetical protein